MKEGNDFMKGMRPAIIIGVILLIAVSWYSLSEDNKVQEFEYNANLDEARTKAEMGIYVDANHSYKTALSMRDSLELRCEIVDYYQESQQYDLFTKSSVALIQKHPKDEAGYRRLVEYYFDQEDFKNSYVFINKASKRNVQSDKINKIYKEIYYKYETKRENFIEVATFFDGLYLVQNKEGYWGYYNQRGNRVVPCIYKKASPFSYEEYAWVYDQKDDFYLINKANEKKYVDIEDKNIEECSSLSSGLMAAKIDGRYSYLNKEFENIFGDFDYASSFHNGIAAVKEAGGWYFINSSNKKLSDKIYKDVKLDDAQKAFRNSLAFVSEDGKRYYLSNGKGEKIGSGLWEDAYPFITAEPTAVRLDGKWGFINKEGNLVIKPQYEDARPFSNGFAAVKIDGKWGYINSEDYKLVIPAEYDEAKEMGSLGNTFVRQEEQWYRLSLYRFNYK